LPNLENAKNYIKERFGVEIGNALYYKGDYWYCHNPSEKYETNGIRALRDMSIGLKPTTYFLQLIGPKIAKNKVELQKEELESLLNGEMIERNMDSKGYVALFYESRCIGCGLYKDSLISTRIPKGRGNELLKSL